nr:AAA family ATPase [Actinomycetota bacterium]
AQDSIERRISLEADLLEEVAALCQAATSARDATGQRAAELERRTLAESDANDATTALRECSRADAEIQARLRSAGEAVTQAEVAAAHLRDRRDEAASELGRIATALGREIEPATQPLADAERAEIDAKLERLARRREALGPVNPLAEAEYEKARSYLNELEEQRTDLENALKELRGLIRDTDRTITEAFDGTFELAKANFEDLIRHLFPGGRGRLRMVSEQGPKQVLGGMGHGSEDGPTAESDERSTDPDEPGREAEDSSGIEIEVTPAGKAMRKLQLLSGGEKSLVALAFVFSVFLARPSPFYILDEVEAALDDANIDRFLQLVRRFSDRAQFIVVTHQKRTMDAADVLYGVSMSRGGISKVISRRMPAETEQAVLGQADAA